MARGFGGEFLQIDGVAMAKNENRLGEELRRLKERKGLSNDKILNRFTERVKKNPLYKPPYEDPSSLSRVMGGSRTPSRSDLVETLTCGFEIADSGEINRVLELADYEALSKREVEQLDGGASLTTAETDGGVQTVFPDKAALYHYVDQLLAQNKIIHDDLGPRSYVAKQHPLSNMQTLWETQKQEQIIPNNARIVAAFHRHRPFVSVEEWSVFSRFQAHVTAFAASAEGTLDSVPLFPIEFAHMVGRKEGSKKEKEQPIEPTLAQLDIFTSTLMKHKKVKDFELIDDWDFPVDQAYKIRRVDKLGTVTVYVTNEYVIGHAELLAIITKCPEINCIVSMSRWNHYTDEAKGYAVRNKVGLFKFGEFLGALHEKLFWQYEPPEPPEPPKDKNKW